MARDSPTRRHRRPHRVSLVTFPDAQILDVTGPLEVFRRRAAGMDLALAMVEDDWGRDAALGTARELVMFFKRPSGQPQVSAHLAVQEATRQRFRDLERWILDHLVEELTVERLAARIAMSPRHFARVFAQETGSTPAKFVATARLELARQRLEESELSVSAVARECGFGTAENMRRAFQRRLGVTPRDYRNRLR